MHREPKSLSAIGICASLLAVLLVGLAGDTVAQSARGGGGGSREQQAMAKMQFLMRQLSKEKAELQARNAQLEREIVELGSDLKRVESSAKQLELKLGRTSDALDRYKETDTKLRDLLQKSQDRTREIIDTYNGRLQEAAVMIRGLRGKTAELEDVSAKRQRLIEDCEGKNKELLQVNTELLERYEKKGFWDAFKQHEPLTGLGAVAIENAIADYRYKLEDLRFELRR
ncbi:hypothetical protein [Halochromatium glycolicum]|jgi:chromosome segregation ATPase|uniref:Uncharacterized protein n=1 Tax=Halochromatium glycolicum TaxID=85075 RepID=A0AAJ0XA76_9GAMM|nr:hypothetical protein [Halochromatium glycolicum]MBK1704512.1 hypothetical protein [Halochromatium glycolicum]